MMSPREYRSLKLSVLAGQLQAASIYIIAEQIAQDIRIRALKTLARFRKF